jgi:steroid delta-isomerase-like uncharacterized protein
VIVVVERKVPSTPNADASIESLRYEGTISMSQQINIEAQIKMGEAVNTGQLQLLREVIAASVVDHDPAADQGSGPEGYIHFFTGLREAFPDLSVAVEHVVADDNNVAFAYTITGTHKGNFLGFPASGTKIKARGMQISRFEDGKIVERWGSSDELGILQQIGVLKLADSAVTA